MIRRAASRGGAAGLAAATATTTTTTMTVVSASGAAAAAGRRLSSSSSSVAAGAAAAGGRLRLCLRGQQREREQRRGIHTWLSISTSGVARADDSVSWDLVEKAAAEKIAKHRRDGKPTIALAGSQPLPSRKQRFSVVFEGIPRQRRPVGSRAERIHFVDRIITDDFLDEADCRRIVGACETAVRDGAFITQQAEVSFVPLQPVTEELVGSFAYRLVLTALEKMRTQVANDYHVPELHFAGALLARLSVPPADAPDNNVHYWNPHIDKANKKEYDFSAILYLNSQSAASDSTAAAAAAAAAAAGASSSGGGGGGSSGGGAGGAEAFSGGSFAFLDMDADRTVSPLAGRMVSFTSGFENPHQVQKVTSGVRYALSVWFTTSAKDAYQVS